MQQLKRILAILVMVISGVMLLVTFAGIAGAWIITSNLSADLIEVVTRAEMRVDNLAQGLDQLETGLDNAGNQIVQIEDTLQLFGEVVEENQPLLTAIRDRLSTRIEPFISTAGQVVTTVVDAVATVNGAVETLNALPFVSIQSPAFDRIDALSQRFEDLQLQVQDVRMAIDQQQSDLVQGVVSIISTPLSKIDAGLNELETRVAGYSQEVETIQEGLSNFKVSIQWWLTLLALIISLLLLWLAFSQVGLFVLARRWYISQDKLVDASASTDLSGPVDDNDDNDDDEGAEETEEDNGDV